MDPTTHLTHDKVQSLVTGSLQTILAENNSPHARDITAETTLLGKRAVIDSLGLVTLLVDLEQRLEEEHGITVTLADERAMSQKTSPFRTIQSLTDYIGVLLEENGQRI